jgi:hypothetical protein
MTIVTDSPVSKRSLSRVAKVLPRLLGILLLAIAFGVVVSRVSAHMARSHEPAGFTRGILQGALMPMSLPNLLVGRDVNIYSEKNTGVTYKLGYTSGVNGCGALFFGFLFWRLNRFRGRVKREM